MRNKFNIKKSVKEFNALLVERKVLRNKKKKLDDNYETKLYKLNQKHEVESKDLDNRLEIINKLISQSRAYQDIHS